MRISLILTSWLLGVCSVGQANDLSPARAEINQGIADLSHWQRDEQPILSLQGQWEFYWSRLLGPDDFVAEAPAGKEYIEVPSSWNMSKDYPEKGYATYRLRVIMSEPQPFMLAWPSIWSAGKIYVDGKMIREIGKVGAKDEPTSYRPHTSRGRVEITPTQPEFDIIVQAVNYEIFLAGLASDTFKIGTKQAMTAQREQQLAISIFVIGAVLIMSLYHFCLYALRTKDRSTLYFGLLCLTSGLYSIVGRDGPLTIFVPDLSYTANIRIYNTWIPGIGVFVYFVHHLFPDLFHRRVAQAAGLFSVSLYIYILLTEPRDFVSKTLSGQLVSALLIPYISYVVIKAVRQKKEGALLFLTGTLIFLAAVVHDMILTRLQFNSIPLGSMGMLSFIVVQSILLARRFSNAFTRVESSEKEIRKLSDELKIEHEQVVSLNENLEQKVEEKTRDIRSIMTHIQLGIFTIADDMFRIGRDHSNHLKEIFETDELTDQNAAQLLFDRSNLSSDERSQAESALSIAVGEDLFLFETNAHCLPREIKRQRRDGDTRILELNWNPIAAANDIIDKILVTVRDVTELRALQEETQDKQEELQFIGELLNVPAEAFRRFINSCHDFINENRKLLNSQSIQQNDLEILKVLFINMHTMKGAARSLYLKRMTRIFHETEQYYAALQKDPNAQWDMDRMNRDLDEVERIVNLYESINQEKLGRKTSGESEIELKESKVITFYRNLIDIDRKTQQWLDQQSRDRLADMKSTLFPHLFAPARSVLDDICQSVRSIAKDLDKPKPEVSITTDDLSLTSVGENVLRKAFVHILRNSMDHGIEKPSERLQKGKTEQGHITIIMQQECDHIQMTVHDDGQGLNLVKIRQIAQQQNLLPPDHMDDPVAIAELIFHSGLSTANKVSDISGRGVGMGAVRQYLRQEGADIRIKIDSTATSIAQGIPFSFEIQLPKELFAEDQNTDPELAA
jgi:HPt (histidine-containing phosphotransfer) domain-containing protein